MQHTQKQLADLPADPTINPAKVLRNAAIYLWRYGWTTDEFYNRVLGEDIPFPPACVAGAIRCAVFGRPVDSLYDEIVDPAHEINARLITCAQTLLADEVDPEWRCADPNCSDMPVCALQVINEWNDYEGRTVSEVLIALYSAADEWDRLHPAHRSDSAVRS
jgi:hypothetical protein